MIPPERFWNFWLLFVRTVLICLLTCKRCSISHPAASRYFVQNRPIPYVALELVDTELRRLEELRVTSPISFSALAARIIVVKQPNGSVRFCAHFSTGLNAALQSNCFLLPAPKDLFTMGVRASQSWILLNHIRIFR